MVPVIDEKGVRLFPCKERRARKLMERGEATPYWQKGIFCIKLNRKETDKREEYPAVAIGIDTGSKREGYTIATAKGVILNITTNTPHWVKDHVETRRILRRARRQRKTPYRKCRENRSSLRNEKRLPPSTKARWDAKLRILNILLRIIPITHLRYEDISAVSKEGKKKWNLSFSPLQVGKQYFEKQLQESFPHLTISKNSGKETSAHRKLRGFIKSKKKLDYAWDTHNVDSHSLCEMVLEKHIEPYNGLVKIEFLQFYRRQLHVQVPTKGNVRKQYGTTVSLGLSRGSVLKYKDKFYFLGGSSKGRLSIHSIITGERVSRAIKKEHIQIMYHSRIKVQLVLID